MNQFELLLQRLKGLPQTLGGAPAAPPSPAGPPMPPQPPGLPGAGPQRTGDIYLPPESGQLDPNSPMAHLPPEVRDKLLREAMMKGMKQ